jgi:hypothetical protein
VVVTALAVTAGAVIGNWVVVLVGGLVTLIAVDHMVARRRSAVRYRKDILGGAAVMVLLALGAASGMSAKLVLFAAMVAVAGAVRVARHPATRARKDQARRKAEREAKLAGLAASWPAAATSAGWPHLHLVRLLDDGVGHTYEVEAPNGQTVDGLRRAINALTSALRVERGMVTVEEDATYPWLAKVHVREEDPRVAFEDLPDEPVDSVADPLMIGPYADGQPYYDRVFVHGHGSVDEITAGSKGGGKSSRVWRKLKVLRKAPDVAWIFLDGAKGRDFKPVARSVFRYVDDPAAALDLLRTAVIVQRNREQYMADMGWRVWRPSADLPVYVLVIEEAATFASSEHSQAIQDNLGILMTKNRATGFSIELLSQGVSGRAIFAPVLRRLFAGRVQFPMNENDETVLSHSLKRGAFDRAPKGSFIAETWEENRGIRVETLWTPDSERPDIAFDMGQNNAFPEAEWEAAEQERARVGSAARGSVRAVPAEAENGALEGVVLGDRPAVTMRPGIRMLPVLPEVEKGPELTESEVDRRFWEEMEAAGSRGMARSEVELIAGKGRTWVDKKLLRPAVASRRVQIVGQGKNTRYVLASAIITP